MTNQRDFLDRIGKELNVNDGWYTITAKTLRDHGAAGLLKKYNDSPSKLLQTVYPEYPTLNYVVVTQRKLPFIKCDQQIFT